MDPEESRREDWPVRRLPWSRDCFVCGAANPQGLRLRARVEGENIVLEHTTRDEDQGWQGVVHGGVTTALVDEVMTWAAILACGRPCVAAEVTVRMLRPIGLGARLRVEGTAEPGARPRLVRTSARVLDEQGETLATATGKYMRPAGITLDLSSAGFVFDDETRWVEELLR